MREQLAQNTLTGHYVKWDSHSTIAFLQTIFPSSFGPNVHESTFNLKAICAIDEVIRYLATLKRFTSLKMS